jgi:hypothetical protein
MKKATLFVAGLFFALTVGAQEKKEVLNGNGQMGKTELQTESFDRIRVKGTFCVALVPGNEKTITLEGDENIIKAITAEVENGRLTIATKDDQPIKPSKGTEIKIRVPFGKLTEVTLVGSGCITSKKTITNNIKATVEGCGSITLTSNCISAEANVLGPGCITIKGQTVDFNCRVIGSGNIKAETLNADIVKATVSGTGNIDVKSNKAITGRISGAGKIAYTGEPGTQDFKRIGQGEFSVF